MATPHPSDDQIRTATVLGPAYQGLMARHGSNFSVQWQVFALGLTAQGFVVGAASQVTNRPITAIMLCAVILFIGAATIISGLRVVLFTDIDRRMLDRYEKTLLVEQYESLRLLHGATFREREEALPVAERSGMSGSVFQRFVISHIVRRYGPFHWWVILVFVISITGASIPILGIFGQ